MNPFPEHGLCPWERCGSYGVVSLLDMLKFSAEDFWKASQILTELRENPALLHSPIKAPEAVRTLQSLMEHLRALKLTISVKEIEKLNQWMAVFCAAWCRQY